MQYFTAWLARKSVKVGDASRILTSDLTIAGFVVAMVLMFEDR
jgi:hypothetical protein